MEIPPRRSTRFVYAPVGRCIYCGQTDVALTLEHIIPESLGGILELPKAVCTICQKIINSYEWTVGRTIFGDFRIRHDLKSKRPKSKRPKHIKITFKKQDGSLETQTISRKEYPAPLFIYKFGKAFILRGMPPGVGKFEWLPYFISSHQEMTSFEDKHGKAVYRFKAVPTELARTIAKIGYSFAIAEFGWGSFDPLPHTIDIILCRTDDVSFTIGGEMELRPPIHDAGHITIPLFLSGTSNRRF